MKKLEYYAINKNLNNKKDIEENIKLALDYAEKSYLSYFMQEVQLNYVSFIDDDNKAEQDGFIKELSNYLRQLLEGSKDVFDRESYDYNTGLKKCEEFKAIAKNRVKVLLAYNDELNVYETVLNLRHYFFNDMDVNLEEDESFAGEIVQFIFSDENNVLINDRIKMIYGQLPLKMSKNRFMNYSDESIGRIKGAGKHAFASYVSYIKENFNPMDTEGFTTEFNWLYDQFSILENMNFDEITLKQYNQYGDVLDSLIIEIEQLMSRYIYGITILNKVIGLLSIVSKGDTKTFTKEICQFNDFFGILFSQSIEEDIYSEELLTVLNTMEDEFEDNIMILDNSDKLIDLLNGGFDDAIKELEISDRLSNLIGCQSLASSSLFDDEIRGYEDDEPMDISTLKTLKSELNSYYQNYLKDKHRSYTMAKYSFMLSLFNVIHHKPEEIYQFVLEMLNNCKNDEEKLACQQLIKELMLT